MPFFSKGKLEILNGAVDLLTDSIKVAALKDTYSVDILHDNFSDVAAHEITDSGYIAGGKVLNNKSVLELNGYSYLKADNLQWLIGGSVDVKWLVIYKNTGTPNTSTLIAFIEYDTPRSVINGSLAINWDPLGIIVM